MRDEHMSIMAYTIKKAVPRALRIA
jgi:hypothetical protein